MPIEKKPDEIEEQPIEAINPAGEAVESDTGVVLAPGADGAADQEEPERRLERHDDGRAAIAERFKKNRGQTAAPVPATGDYTDPAQYYGLHGKPPEPEPKVEPEKSEGDAPTDQADADDGDSDPTESPAPQPKIKMIVRGKEREVTQDELIALAQKAAAGDSYLEDARRVFEAAKQTTRVQVSRQHHDDNPAISTDTGTDPEPETTDQHPDPFRTVVEKIQYGDPDEAASILRNTFSEMAEGAVKRVSIDSRVQQDIANDMRSYDEFVKANQDIANDKFAVASVKEAFLEGYRQDLRDIGVSDDQIPTDPDVLAKHHRYYKLQGQPVRSVATLLENAKQEFNRWRGPTEATHVPQPTSASRIHVNVNRDERRKAINHQPTRATVPSQLMAPTAPTGAKSRADAVAAAKRARGQA